MIGGILQHIEQAGIHSGDSACSLPPYSLSNELIEEISNMVDTPKMFQFYFHKDRGLNNNMIERAKAANFDVLALTVDTITGGNRERDLRTGFTSPPQLTLTSLLSYVCRPKWAINYLIKPKFELPHLQDYIGEGTNIAISIGDYFSTMLDQSVNWNDAEKLCSDWGGHFALKGIMSVDDAKRAVDIGRISEKRINESVNNIKL